MTITVEYKGHFGDDKSIADNARVSFDSDADKYTEAQNENLLKYLATGMRTKERESLIDCLEIASRDGISQMINKHRHTPTHWVPFAHTFIKLVCNAPVPIRTQCFKHKVGLVESEVSRRYITSTPTIFIPDHFRIAADDVKQGSGGTHPENKIIKDLYTNQTNAAVELYKDFIARGVCPEQARSVLPQGAEVKWVFTSTPTIFIPDHFRIVADDVKQGSGGTHPDNVAIKEAYTNQTNAAVELYKDFIARGVCPEQARFVLPQGAEVKWVWSGNLYAFANFYIARSDSHAQKEVQILADKVDKIIRPLFPKAWSFLVDF